MRPIVLIPFDSPHYPLPADVSELDDEGSRQARVNGCRQWIHWWELGHLENYARALPACVRLFDLLYLHPQPEMGDVPAYDPLFYRGSVSHLEAPGFHYDILAEHARWGYLAFCGPRGSAKTTGVFKKKNLCKMVTLPGYNVTYCTVKQSLSDRFGDDLRYQLYHNSLLQDDWAPEPEFDGELKPLRSEAAQGMGNFYLKNRSEFIATSIQSTQRGLRTIDYDLDDPEYDPEGEHTNLEEIRSKIARKLDNVILPQITGAGQAIIWGGTFISVRHYLWAVMQVKPVVLDGVTTMRAEQETFNEWKRKVYPIFSIVKGKKVSLWPQKWPVDEAEKKALNLHPTTKTLERLEASTKPSTWLAEYLCKPQQIEGAYWPVVTKNRHGYWYEKPDDKLGTTPHLSTTLICWVRAGTTIKLPLKDFCARFSRFITLDTSYTDGTLSDFKVACCMAVTDCNELFVLDLWAGQTKQPVLVEATFRMADRWHAASLNPEVVKQSITLYHDLRETVANRSYEVFGLKHCPAVFPIKPGVVNKADRIDSSLTRRFLHDLIKLPMDCKDMPPWDNLFHQISGFNPSDREGCGLPHDDHIDAVAASQLVGRRAMAPVAEVGGPPKTPVEQLRAGQHTDPETGMPNFARALAQGSLTPDDVDAILTQAPPTSDRQESTV